MPSTNQLLAFVVASILFIQVPGPSLLFTIGRALTVGRRDALLSVVGNTLGLVVQVAGVALGLGRAGGRVGHGVHLAQARRGGVRRVAGHPGDPAPRGRPARDDGRRPARRRAAPRRGGRCGPVSWSGVTNPKTIVFFAAFLPQFIDPGAPAAPQLLLLGAVFGVLAVASDSCWALAAGRARDWFAREPRAWTGSAPPAA